MNNVDGIIVYNSNRGLLGKPVDREKEFVMLMEEVTELRDAINNGDTYEVIDALQDLQVLCVGWTQKEGYSPTLALSETVKEISSRTGIVNETTGKFEKRITGKEYKAVYDNAKYKRS